MKKVCNCGTEFTTYDKRPNRAKYCSKKCMYEFRPKTPWNKGLKGVQVAWNKGKECDWKEEKHALWKETGYGYSAVHNWVRKYKTMPDKCEECGSIKRLEWANIDHEYKRKLNDYKCLCKKCHIKYDRQNGWGVATRRFSL